MTDQIPDPFAGMDENEDEFATAKTEYLRVEDLDERLVIFEVLKVGTKKSSSGGGDYEYVECNVIVLDGDPIEPFISTIPGSSTALHVTNAGIVPQLKEYAGSGKPFLARLDSVPSRQNRNIKVMGVKKHEVTVEDKKLALPVWRKYKTSVPF